MSEPNVLIWLIPVLIVLAAAVALFFLVRRWQAEIPQDLKQIGSQRRQLIASSRDLIAAARRYPPDSPEPYTAPARSLDEALAVVQQQLDTLNGLYGETRQAAQDVAPRSWRKLVGTPVFWYRLRQQVAGLRARQSEIPEALSSAGALIDQLDRMGWMVAQKAQACAQQLQETRQRLDDLRLANASGAALETALAQLENIQAALEGIPAAFYLPDEQAVLEQVSQPGVVDAHRAISAQQPGLQSLAAQAQAWSEDYQQATRKSAALQKSAEDLRAALKTMPAGLILSEAITRSNEFAALAASLKERLTAPAVEQLKPAAAEAGAALEAAHALTQQLRNARTHLPALQQAITRLNQDLQVLLSQMAEMESRPVYPLSWDQTRPALESVKAKLISVGAADKPRTPEMVETDLAAIQDLTASFEKTRRAAPAKIEEYREVIDLRAKLDPAGNADWFAGALKLADQISDYNPENWQREDDIAGLPADLDATRAQCAALIPPLQTAPLAESSLTATLRQHRQVDETFNGLQNRVGRIHERYEQLQSLSSEAGKNLAIIQAAMNQVDLLCDSNPELQAITAREIDRLWAEGETLATELSQRDKGTLERKAARAEAFVEKVQAAGNNWLTALGRKIQAQNEILTDQLARLNTAATFDDPILAEAEAILRAEQTSRAPAARGPAARSEALPLPRLMAQFKTENDTWQRLAAVSRKVAEEVERPVMEAYLKAESARADAQARLEEANKRVPNTRAWPPSLQTLQAESQEFRETELRWERVRREPARAISLVTAIGELAQRYQSLAERVARAVERFENEQNRVRALENEIATSLQMWQMLTRVHTDDPTAAGGIRQVIDNHTRELEDLKRRYLQGQLTYYQVEQELRGLLRRINNTDVPLDSGEVMDINGVIRSGRM